MLTPLLCALSALPLPAPLIAPQSSCREAKLEEGGTSTDAVQFLAKQLQAQARKMEMLLSAGSREAGTRKKVILRRASTQLHYQHSQRAEHLCLWQGLPASQGHGGVYYMSTCLVSLPQQPLLTALSLRTGFGASPLLFSLFFPPVFL